MKNLYTSRLSYMFILSALSACSSNTGFSAGALSSHIPQSYETTTSTAARTSTLGGSATVGVFTPTYTSFSAAAVPTTGSLTHDTGRIQVDDGSYNFIDPNGPDPITGQFVDGAGVVAQPLMGVGQPFTGTYAYVQAYRMGYDTATAHHVTIGVSGIMTAPTDMPTGGTATYTGEARTVYSQATTTSGVSYILDHGTSTVAVDFGAGTVDVQLGSFTQIQQKIAGVSSPIGASAAPIDQVHGRGLTINGTHFSGGTWQTLKGITPVDLMGAGASTTSNGTFFGYDATRSAPAEVGGVIVSVASGGGSYLSGSYIAK